MSFPRKKTACSVAPATRTVRSDEPSLGAVVVAGCWKLGRAQEVNLAVAQGQERHTHMDCVVLCVLRYARGVSESQRPSERVRFPSPRGGKGGGGGQRRADRLSRFRTKFRVLIRTASVYQVPSQGQLAAVVLIRGEGFHTASAVIHYSPDFPSSHYTGLPHWANRPSGRRLLANPFTSTQVSDTTVRRLQQHLSFVPKSASGWAPAA